MVTGNLKALGQVLKQADFAACKQREEMFETGGEKAEGQIAAGVGGHPALRRSVQDQNVSRRKPMFDRGRNELSTARFREDEQELVGLAGPLLSRLDANRPQRKVFLGKHSASPFLQEHAGAAFA